MITKNIEFRVGFVVIFALVIFVGTVIWIQGYRFGKNNYRVSVLFDEVGSLAKGDPVMVSGIKKGKVKDLFLIEDGVKVDIILSKDVILKEDAIISVKNIGLMGERFLAVKPGKSARVMDLSVPIRGNYDTGIPEAMGMMGDMIDELRNLVHSLKNSIASDENLAKFTRIVSNFEELSKSLAAYVNRNDNKLDETAENFLKASAELRKLAVGNAGRIDSVIARVDGSSKKLESLTNDLSNVALSAREFADKLNKGDGTLQMLVNDRRLYDDLRRTAGNIDDLVNDIRANPGKYIRLTVKVF
ncbi:MAG: MlaD family protein [candidate division Zixibacteria bacterium]|nr:MlaD family protein [candidate division Zixibacteria bacterium]